MKPFEWTVLTNRGTFTVRAETAAKAVESLAVDVPDAFVEEVTLASLTR